MIESILVPLDGSDLSEFALEPAVEMAARTDALLEVLTVVDPDADTPEVVGGKEAAEMSAGRYLADVEDRIRERTGGSVTRAVFRGPPAESIEMRAAATGVDLVVMASHGRGPLSRFWLGSVTDRFVRRAPCPVLVVRPRKDRKPGPVGGFGVDRVLVPVDPSRAAGGAAPGAVDLARAFQARLRFMTAVLPDADEGAAGGTGSGAEAELLPGGWNPEGDLTRERVADARERLEALAEEWRQAGAGVEIDTAVAQVKAPAEGILDAAREWEADVVAMVTHGRGAVDKAVLGSVADKVLRAADVPVLLCRSDPSGHSAARWTG